MSRTNWAGNYHYAAPRLLLPKTVEEVQEMVAQSTKVKALGTRHSFNGIADCEEKQISLADLEPTFEIDHKLNRVTVDGAARYSSICEGLHLDNYALHNLASLPHISVAGAVATATHGSGVGNGNLATSVRAFELVRANGEVIHISRDANPGTFACAAVHLGALGLVTKVTLDLVPTFDVRQTVFRNLSFARLDRDFDEIVSSAYSVSLFTDWRGDHVGQVWLKERTDEANHYLEPEFFGAISATEPMHPIAELSAENCTEQMGVAGPWHERLPHFRHDFTPSAGDEMQSEYFIPRKFAREAIAAIRQIGDRVSPHLMISEIRTIDADSLWMSPCFEEPSIAIHFTWVMDWPSVQALLPVIEAALEPFDVRPHWGKLFTMSRETLRSKYRKLSDFEALATELDPTGKFRNLFLQNSLFSD
ncbi:MAG: D-arabinono-1,4-lactone oxidase [Chthonomonadales bacterium]